MNQTEKLDFIFQTGKKIRCYMDTVLADPSDPGLAELSILQLKVAMQVHFNEPLSLSSLAEILDLSHPSASVLVDKLVEKKILNREPDPDDRRKIQLRVHPQARPSLEDIQKRLQLKFQRVAGKVGDENVERWYKVMRKISEILEEESKVK
jgi:DNA-binding MarR family transcriptional regulator